MQLRDDDPERDWTESGVFTVAPDVYRIPLPLRADGLRAVNVYALRADPGLVLIDSGQAIHESAELLPAALDAIGYGPTQVSRFLITHIHVDHYTHAVVVRREHGTPIGLGEHEKPSMDVICGMTSDGPRLNPQVIRLRRGGAPALADELEQAARFQPRHARDYWEPPDTWIRDGDPIPAGERTLLPLHTPGHTRGHLVFWDKPGGLMFTGDHILPHITPSIGFEAFSSELPLGDYLDSLHRVRTLPDARMLPAHGRVTAGVHARVDALLEHHDTRLTAMLKAVEAGASTAYDVARQVPWTRREKSLDDLDLFNKMLAVNETLAHLDLLVDQARISATQEADTTRFW
jgi:glyoxylase-like metal-dependent hydrolase (beta-lactamase superfamily II)